METKKAVLVIGIAPEYLDFSSPEFSAIPDISAEKIFTGITGSVNALNELGYDAEVCWIDLGKTATEVIKIHLQKKDFDCIAIGAGIRKPDSNFTLFENIINVIHNYAIKGKICFNTNPMDTVAAVQRWV